MNIKGVKDCILGSMVATMFAGLGFGIAIASTIPVVSLGGFITGIVSFIVILILLRKVEKSEYKISVIIERRQDE